MTLTKNIFLFLLLTTSVTAFALDRQVTVTGSCSRQVTTDRGSMVITADIRDDNLKNAIKRATRQYERALEAIKKKSARSTPFCQTRKFEKNRTSA